MEPGWGGTAEGAGVGTDRGPDWSRTGKDGFPWVWPEAALGLGVEQAWGRVESQDRAGGNLQTRAKLRRDLGGIEAGPGLSWGMIALGHD